MAQNSKEHGAVVYDLVLHAYTDGVSLSGSSLVKFWPLEFIVCQISPHVRFRFVLIAGIWVDKTDPLMNSYLLPFTDELIDLYENGVTWTHPKSKIEFTAKVSVPGFCGDAPVRAQGQNLTQHGGRNCCNICEQKMVRCRREGTDEKKRVFTFKETNSRLRTAERMELQGKETMKMKREGRRKHVKLCKGVKGRSVIPSVPCFDRSTAFYPEYMHIVLGLVKQFLNLFFETKRQDVWSLKDHKDDISTLLTDIKVLDY